jgi:hypothetical protein
MFAACQPVAGFQFSGRLFSGMTARAPLSEAPSKSLKLKLKRKQRQTECRMTTGGRR